MQTIETDPEIVDSIPNETTIPRADSPAIWNEYRAKAEALKATAETLKVTSIEDTAGQKLARATRLSLREIRLAVEKRRKELVEDKTKEVSRINGAAKEVRDYCESLEGRLLEQEQFIERETIRIEDERRATRGNALRPYTQSLPTVDLGKISDSEFESMLNDAKELHALRLKREQEAEAARIAKQREEAEEKERIRKENELLKAQAEAREAVMAEERRKAAEAREAEAKARKAEREAAEKIREAERQEALAREREIEAKRAKERAEVEAERKAAEAEARRERQAREEIERKQAAAEAAEKMRLAKIAAEEKRRLAEESEAQRLAALAPDKEKLIKFADMLASLVIPPVSTAEAAVFAATIHDRISSLAERIKEKAALL